MRVKRVNDLAKECYNKPPWIIKSHAVPEIKLMHISALCVASAALLLHPRATTEPDVLRDGINLTAHAPD